MINFEYVFMIRYNAHKAHLSVDLLTTAARNDSADPVLPPVIVACDSTTV